MEIETSNSCDQPVRNPAIPRVPEVSDNSLDDSPALQHLRALAVAAHALVGIDPARASERMAELLSLLNADGRLQSSGK
jgi:hypothetical protein